MWNVFLALSFFFFLRGLGTKDLLTQPLARPRTPLAVFPESVQGAHGPSTERPGGRSLGSYSASSSPCTVSLPDSTWKTNQQVENQSQIFIRNWPSSFLNPVLSSTGVTWREVFGLFQSYPRDPGERQVPEGFWEHFLCPICPDLVFTWSVMSMSWARMPAWCSGSVGQGSHCIARFTPCFGSENNVQIIPTAKKEVLKPLCFN